MIIFWCGCTPCSACASASVLSGAQDMQRANSGAVLLISLFTVPSQLFVRDL